MTKEYTPIPYSGYNSEGLQVFTPRRIETVAAGGTLNTTKITAIRIATANYYQINGTGPVATMPPGCTGIANHVTSIKFTDPVNVEVM